MLDFRQNEKGKWLKKWLLCQKLTFFFNKIWSYHKFFFTLQHKIRRL